MARKLPWDLNATARSTPCRLRATPRSKARRAPSVSDNDQHHIFKAADDSSTTTSSTPRKRRRVSRTPSTSPPPQLPEVEYMREGYADDDIYMMVEDEFNTIAQSFTRHLHHAEYVRLKKKAREAPRLDRLETYVGMRAETKKFEAVTLRGRQKAAIKAMVTVKAGSGDETEAGEDPWQGTTLAGLMGGESRKVKTALVGLEVVKSETRAARGFQRVNAYGLGKVHRMGPDGFEEKDDLQDRSSRKHDAISATANSEEASEPPLSRPVASKPPAYQQTVHPKLAYPAPPINHQSNSKPKPTALRRRAIDFDDGFDDDAIALPAPTPAPTEPLPSPTSKQAADRKIKKAKEEEQRRTRQLGEVPTFLI